MGSNRDSASFSLVDSLLVNPIRVDPDVAHWSRIALDQMLALPGETAKD